MSNFGCRIKQKGVADTGSGLSAGAQFVNFSPQGPLSSVFAQVALLRKVQGDFYEVLREKIPIFDAAINRLVSLNGTVKIIGDNAKLVSELEDIALNIPVNDHQKGINAFQSCHSNEAFEQGFAYGEMIATRDLKDIAELRVADSKFVVFRLNKEGRSEPWYRYVDALANTNRFYPGNQNNIMQALNRPLESPFASTSFIGGQWEAKLNPNNKIYLSFNNENTDPHGVSIMRSTEFVASILATIQTSFQHAFRRWGDPIYHVDYKTSKKNLGDGTLKERREELEAKFAAVQRAKSLGQSVDLVTAHDPDSEVSIKVIGADGKFIPAQIPLQHLMEQITAKTGLPPWMYGIYFGAAAGTPKLEIENVLQDTKVRQFAMMPEYIRIFSNILALRGRTWKSINTSMDPNKPGDWGVIFETPNLRDEVARANARFMNAEADVLLLQASSGRVPEVGNPKPEKPKPGKAAHNPACSCGCKDVDGEKELTRSRPWPELDRVETDYENKLKSGWNELSQKCLAILKLGPMPKGVDGETFTFSGEERQRIMAEMESFIGEFEPVDGSPLRMYYGQSYSLGLIQAAHLVGESRPILDIIKNREIYDELVKNGFELLKNNVTKQIVGKILPEIQAHILAGSNPLNVAERLKNLFGAQNNNWERLARTEMSMAAEQAKVDEWGKRGINVKNAIIAGKNTHPHCRCANTVQQVDGKWVLKFVPAPDACGICLALAT